MTGQWRGSAVMAMATMCGINEDERGYNFEMDEPMRVQSYPLNGNRIHTESDAGRRSRSMPTHPKPRLFVLRSHGAFRVKGA